MNERSGNSLAVPSPGELLQRALAPSYALERQLGRGGMGGDLLCFVMGFVDGETLTERVRLGGPLGTDFGIARGIAVHGADTLGEIAGTPHFMSPEQAAGDAVDGRADLYSLGIVAFYAVTARVPFDGDNANAIIAQQLMREPPSIAGMRPDLPEGLLSTIGMLLKKDPAARFQTGEAVVEALDALRAMRLDVAPSIRLFLSLASALGVGAIVLACASPHIVRIAHYDADRAVLATLLITIIVALVSRLVAGVRALAEQGFGYAAFRRAVVAANIERRAVHAQRKLGLRWRERRRRRAWGLGIGFVASAFVLALVRALRTNLGNGIYEVGRTGLLLAVIGAVAMMIVVLLVLSDVIGAVTTTPLSHRVWISPVGRAFYRIATIGLTESPTSTPSVSSQTR